MTQTRSRNHVLAIISIGFFVMAAVLTGSSQGESIDQMIWQASETVNTFDQMADLNEDFVLYDMDMRLTIEQYIQLTTDDDDDGGRKKRKATKRQQSRWTNNVIPYTLDSRAGFSSRDRGEIMKAISEWETYTCLDFRRRSGSDRNYVNFDNGNGCYSYVGMTGGSQKIGLARGCRYKGVVVHEIGHAVGFHHEQNRPDRDNYVTILFQNIPSSVRYNFKKYPWSAVDTFGVPYDYTSVMHYGGKAFSTNNQYTIKTKRSEFQNTIGNRAGLSFKDVKLANLMYKCGSQCSNVQCPSGAYVSKHCKCMCPGSPAKECDGTTTGTRTTRPTSRPRVTTTPPAQCQDGHKSCPAWAKSSENYCQTNTYVKNYCKKSCKFCDKEPVTVCVDLKESCSYWKTRGYCTKVYVDYMKQNCAKTCGHCKSSRLGSGGEGGGEAGAGGTGAALRASTLVVMTTLPLAILSTLMLQTL